MPTPEDIRNTDEWQSLDSVIDVRAFYKNNNAEPEIQRIISLENRKFGSVIEKMIRQIFLLSSPESTQHDAIFIHDGRRRTKIEIKAARYWAGTSNCKWQHLEPKYDYTHILFVLVDFDAIRVWIADKAPLFEHGILVPQGKQGYWGDKDALLASGYLTEVHTASDLSNELP